MKHLIMISALLTLATVACSDKKATEATDEDTISDTASLPGDTTAVDGSVDANPVVDVTDDADVADVSADAKVDVAADVAADVTLATDVTEN